MKLHIIAIGAAAIGLLTLADVTHAMPAPFLGAVAGDRADIVQARYGGHYRVIYRCPRYGHQARYGYEGRRYGYIHRYGAFPGGYAYGEGRRTEFRYGTRHAGSHTFVEQGEARGGKRVIGARSEKYMTGRSSTKSTPGMEREQRKPGKAGAPPMTKGKSDEGRSASPGSTMPKASTMPKKERPSTTEKGGASSKGGD
jgi:hypothetical protein